MTPILTKSLKKHSDESIDYDAFSDIKFEDNDDKRQSNSDSEYYTAKSVFTTESNTSSSNQK